LSREVTLPSGAKLTVNIAPFKDAKNLFQVMAKEWKGLDPKVMASAQGMTSMFMSAFSSTDVDKALWPCMARSLYDGEKITPDSFEAEASRQDFIPSCLEVVSENIVPFTKGLFSGSETPSQAATTSQP
jgi:hypothetical protein